MSNENCQCEMANTVSHSGIQAKYNRKQQTTLDMITSALSTSVLFFSKCILNKSH